MQCCKKIHGAICTQWQKLKSDKNPNRVHLRALTRCHVRVVFLWLRKEERPQPVAAEFSSSVSKWRHMGPVRFQLCPDCFPEALESSPSLLFHRRGVRSIPQDVLGWRETSLFMCRHSHSFKEFRWASFKNKQTDHFDLGERSVNAESRTVVAEICR